MKTKLAALMLLSGAVVHSLLLLTLQDEPRGSSGPAARNEFKLNNWRHKFSFDVPVQDVPGAEPAAGALAQLASGDPGGAVRAGGDRVLGAVGRLLGGCCGGCCGCCCGCA